MADNVGLGKLLVDLKVTNISAGATINSVVTGNNTNNGAGTVIQTPSSVGSAAPSANYYWDVRFLRIFPGVVQAGSSVPDLQAWVHVDGQSYANWFYMDLTAAGNIFPRRENTVGERWLALGDSILAWALKMRQGATPPKNPALRFTGWKVATGITVYFTSTAGFTASQMVSSPRIQMYGDVYDEAAMALVQGSNPMSAAISIASLRKLRHGQAPYQKTFEMQPMIPENWQSLPGGSRQGTTKVNRYVKWSTPQQDIVGTTVYPLTTITSVGGTADNVLNTQDLGYEFARSNDMLMLMEFGRRPGAGAGYFNLDWGNNDYAPLDTPFGAVCTIDDNPIPYGQAEPTRSESGLYLPLPKWAAWDPMSEGFETIYGETVAVALAAQNGATITAGTDKTTVGGVLVTASGR